MHVLFCILKIIKGYFKFKLRERITTLLNILGEMNFEWILGLKEINDACAFEKEKWIKQKLI